MCLTYTLQLSMSVCVCVWRTTLRQRVWRVTLRQCLTYNFTSVLPSWRAPLLQPSQTSSSCERDRNSARLSVDYGELKLMFLWTEAYVYNCVLSWTPVCQRTRTLHFQTSSAVAYRWGEGPSRNIFSKALDISNFTTGAVGVEANLKGIFVACATFL